MRWIGCIVALCLLVAGASRSHRCDGARTHDEMAATGLVKVAPRKLDLDPCALPDAPSFDAPPVFVVESIEVRRNEHVVVEATVMARGPPVA